MKKLSMMCICVLALFLLAGPAVAQIAFQVDFLEGGNSGGWTGSAKTFEDTWTMSPGETIEADIWVTGAPADPGQFLTAGSFIQFDVASVNITGVALYDGTDLPGPWDVGLSLKVPDAAGPGTWLFTVGNLSCIDPDVDGDYCLGKVTFECQAAGTADIDIDIIGGFDTVVACDGTIYDSLIPTKSITIDQVDTCVVDEDCDDGVDCTDDTCVSLICDYSPNDGNCTDDGQYCTGDEVCDPVEGCVSSGDPCIPPEVCDEGSDACVVPPCEVTIVPDTTTVVTGEEFQFTTTTEGTCNTPCYTWSISNQESTGSSIDNTGLYTGGSGPGTDTVTVTDPCNGDITDDAMVTVEDQPCVSDGDCDDGLYCNGAETCDIGGTDSCQPGIPFDCDDGVACTDDSCDEDADSCVNTPNDANCDDGVYCNGAETCDADDDCQMATDPCADLGLECNEALEGCDCGVDSECDDGLYCTGGELCGVDSICEADPAVPPTDCPDDGKYCNGDEICVEGADSSSCESAGNPCPSNKPICSEGDSGPVCRSAIQPPQPCTTNADCDDSIYCNGEEECIDDVCVEGIPPCESALCDEDSGTCADCLVDGDCDDGVACTDDTCVEETCVYTPNDGNCPDDGIYCNGEEFCDETEGCSSTGDPCAANQTCDEDNNTCVLECAIDVIRDDFPKSNWYILYPVLMRIEATGDFRDDLNLFSRITIACDSDDNGLFPTILQTGKVVVPSLGTNTTMIWQTALIWPALLTGNFGEDSETCTLSVAGCADTDTFELDILSVFGIPVSE